MSVPATQQDLVFYAGRARTELREWHVEHVQSATPTVIVEFRNTGERLSAKSVRVDCSNDNLETFARCPKMDVEAGSDVGAPLRIRIPEVPFGKAQAARNWIRVTVSTEAGQTTSCTLPVTGSSTASVQLGKSDFEDGLYHLQCADGGTMPAHENHRECRRNAEPTGRVPDCYLYFAVDNNFAYAGSAKRIELGVTYLDVPDGTLELQYDAVGAGADHVYRSGGAAPFTGSSRWRTHTFEINEPTSPTARILEPTSDCTLEKTNKLT